ncbi:ATP-binding cassette sub-family C member 9-like protein, partial [Leptotrombidium deliense]
KRGKRINSGNQNEKVCYMHPFASYLSKWTFAWLLPLLKLGYRRPIELEDLGELPKELLAEHQYTRFAKSYNEERQRSETHSKPISLWRCYWSTFKYSLLIGALLRFCADMFALVAPISIKYIIKYVETVQNETEYEKRKEADFETAEVALLHSKLLTCGEYFSNGYVLAIVVFIFTCLQSTFSNTFNHCAILEGIHLRSSLQCLIYKKALKMTVGQGRDLGAIVNHMSQDAFNMMMLFSMGHYVWALPLKIAILLTLLYFQLGVSALIGAAAIYILAPIQSYLASKLSKIQKEALKLSDERLKKTSELLMGIKLLKLLGWEFLFSAKVSDLRDKELKVLKMDAIYVAIITFLTQATSVIVTLVTFVLYPYIEGESLNAETVFTALALFNQLTVPLYIIPFVIPIVVNAIISTKRLNTFLSQPEIDYTVPWRNDRKLSMIFDCDNNECDNCVKRDSLETLAIQTNGNFNNEAISHENVVEVSKGYFSWNVEEENPFLKDINLKVPVSQLTVIWGNNGSGKSSLISALLGEMITLHGKLNWSPLVTSVAYLPQEPWLLNVSFRENILFGSQFDSKRYKQVIEACALQADLDILPAKDRTEIGERGVNLSGGQRQRIALARVLYSRAKVVLLDSPMSALDSRVSTHVFEKAIKQFLLENDRTVIMVTQKVEHVQQASHVILVEKGTIRMQGEFKHLQTHDSSFRDELQRFKDIECNLKKELFVEDRTNSERQKLRRLLSKQVLYRTSSGQKTGSIHKRSVPFFRQVSHDPSSPLPCQECNDYNDEVKSLDSDNGHQMPNPPLFMRMQSIDSATSKTSVTSVFKRSMRRLISKQSSNNTLDSVDNRIEEAEDEEDSVFTDDSIDGESVNGRLMTEEERKTGKVSNQVYMNYIRAFSIQLAVVVFCLICLSQLLRIGTDFWLTEWTQAKNDVVTYINSNSSNFTTARNSEDEHSDKLHNYLIGYVLLSIATIIISLITNLVHQLSSIRAVRKLHKNMLDCVVRAPTTFFDSTPIGRILNRFSSDMTVVDKKLSTTLPLLLRFLFLCFAAVIVDVIVTPVFIFIAIPIVTVYYLLQRFFRFTSRELQRLDNLTRSPIVAHFNQTLLGLSTIRAFKEEESFISLVLDYINLNNLAFLMANCANCWLGIALDYLGAIILFAATITTLIAATHGSITASYVGIAITYTLLVPIYLNWVVRNLANLEMHMSAVERISFYTKIEAEKTIDTSKTKSQLTDYWPSTGNLKFDNVTLSYGDESKAIL